jgi:integrase
LTLARISSNLSFSVAAALWLESRSFRGVPGAVSARYIREKTEFCYAQYVDSLNLFFSQLPLEKIHLGHLKEYQEARFAGAAPWFVRYRRPQDAKSRRLKDGTELPPKGKQPCPAKPKQINQELCILKMILRRAGCWSEEMDEFYERLEEEVSDIPRALAFDEQRRWLDVAQLSERWWIVHWYSDLAFGTSMGTNEMRSLRIGDVNLVHGIVSVPSAGAKNPYRARTIPLITAEAKWAAEQLLKRAHDLGATEPQHFLFPFRQRCNPKGQQSRHGVEIPDFDPTRPMTVGGIKKLWDEVRKAAGLTWFRPYDTRHTALTRWAESGMDIPMLLALAGHVSIRMLRHYVHISDGAKRRALETAMHQVAPKQPAPPKFGPESESSPAPSLFYAPRAAIGGGGWRFR